MPLLILLARDQSFGILPITVFNRKNSYRRTMDCDAFDFLKRDLVKYIKGVLFIFGILTTIILIGNACSRSTNFLKQVIKYC